MAIGYAPYFRWHGGGEQGDLALRWRLLQNPFHIVDKAHAQHFVGFIQYQGSKLIELQGALSHMIHHPTGRAYYYMGAALQCANLAAIFLTTVYR